MMMFSRLFGHFLADRADPLQVEPKKVVHSPCSSIWHIICPISLLLAGTRFHNNRCWNVVFRSRHYPEVRLVPNAQFFVLFDLIYNILGFVENCKKLHFTRSMINAKWYDIGFTGRSRTQNEEVRQILSFLWCLKLDVTYDLTKDIPCEVTFFEVTFETSFWAENWFLYFWDDF